jgi:hypothetical protein
MELWIMVGIKFKTGVGDSTQDTKTNAMYMFPVKKYVGGGGGGGVHGGCKENLIFEP